MPFPKVTPQLPGKTFDKSHAQYLGEIVPSSCRVIQQQQKYVVKACKDPHGQTSLLTISNICDRQILSGYKGMLTSFHVKYLKAENQSALGLSVLHYTFSTSSSSEQLHCPSNTLLRSAQWLPHGFGLAAGDGENGRLAEAEHKRQSNGP